MSAWYVFSSMGFYPVCPGSNEYQLSSPQFSKVELNLDKDYYPGGKFTLKAVKNHAGKIYKSISYNKVKNGFSINNEQLKQGGKMIFR